jgi:hypothetical protein
VDDQIEAEIRKDLVSIKTFDENKDGVLDDNEIKNAVSKAKLWASESIKDSKDWLYYGTEGQIGPMTWKEIEEISSKYPKVFISNTAANPNPNKQAVHWLPAKIVFFAKKALFL